MILLQKALKEIVQKLSINEDLSFLVPKEAKYDPSEGRLTARFAVNQILEKMELEIEDDDEVGSDNEIILLGETSDAFVAPQANPETGVKRPLCDLATPIKKMRFNSDQNTLPSEAKSQEPDLAHQIQVGLDPGFALTFDEANCAPSRLPIHTAQNLPNIAHNIDEVGSDQEYTDEEGLFSASSTNTTPEQLPLPSPDGLTSIHMNPAVAGIAVDSFNCTLGPEKLALDPSNLNDFMMTSHSDFHEMIFIDENRQLPTMDYLPLCLY